MNNNNKKKYRKIALLATATASIVAGSMSAYAGAERNTTAGGGIASTGVNMDGGAAVVVSGSWIGIGANHSFNVDAGLGVDPFVIAGIKTTAAPLDPGLIVAKNTSLGSVGGTDIINSTVAANVTLTLTGTPAAFGVGPLVANTYTKLGNITALGNMTVAVAPGAVVGAQATPWVGKFIPGGNNITLTLGDNSSMYQATGANEAGGLHAVNIGNGATFTRKLGNNAATTFNSVNLQGVDSTFEFIHDVANDQTLNIAAFANPVGGGGILKFATVNANGDALTVHDNGANVLLGTDVKKLKKIILGADTGEIKFTGFTHIYAQDAELDLRTNITMTGPEIHFANTNVTAGTKVLALKQHSALEAFDFANHAASIKMAAGKNLTIAPKSTGANAGGANAGDIELLGGGNVTLNNVAGIVTFATPADIFSGTTIQNIPSLLTLNGAGDVLVKEGTSGFSKIAANADSVFKLDDKAVLVARSPDGTAGGFDLGGVGNGNTFEFAGDGRVISREMGNANGLGNIQLSNAAGKKNVFDTNAITFNNGKNLVFREANTTLEFNGLQSLTANAGNGINIDHKLGAIIKFSGKMPVGDVFAWNVGSGIANAAADTRIISAVKDNAGNAAGYLSLGKIAIGKAGAGNERTELVSEGGGFMLEANARLTRINLATYDAPIALNAANGEYKLVIINEDKKGSIEVFDDAKILEGSVLGAQGTALRELKFKDDYKAITLEKSVNFYGNINVLAGKNGGVVYLDGDDHAIVSKIEGIAAVYFTGTNGANTTHAVNFDNTTAPNKMGFGFVAENGSRVTFATGNTTSLTGINFVSGQHTGGAKAGGGLVSIDHLNAAGVTAANAVAKFVANNANPVVFNFENNDKLEIKDAYVVADVINLKGTRALDLSHANNKVYVNQMNLNDQTLRIGGNAYDPTVNHLASGVLINNITTTTDGGGRIEIVPAPGGALDFTTGVRIGTQTERIGEVHILKDMDLTVNEGVYVKHVTTGENNATTINYKNTNINSEATLFDTTANNNLRFKAFVFQDGGAVKVDHDAGALKFTIENKSGVTFTKSLDVAPRAFELAQGAKLIFNGASVKEGSAVTPIAGSNGHTFEFNGAGGVIPEISKSGAGDMIENVKLVGTDTRNSSLLSGDVYVAAVLRMEGAFSLPANLAGDRIVKLNGGAIGAKDLHIDLGKKNLVLDGIVNFDSTFTLCVAPLNNTNNNGGAPKLETGLIKLAANATLNYNNTSAFNLTIDTKNNTNLLDAARTELQLIDESFSANGGNIAVLYSKLANVDAGTFLTVQLDPSDNKLYIMPDFAGGAKRLANDVPEAADVTKWLGNNGSVKNLRPFIDQLTRMTKEERKTELEKLQGGLEATTASASEGIVNTVNNVLNTQFTAAAAVAKAEEEGVSAGDDANTSGINVFTQGFGSHAERDKQYKSNLGGAGAGFEFYADDARKTLIGVFGWGAKAKTKTHTGSVKTHTNLGGGTVYFVHNATDNAFFQGAATYGSGKSKFQGGGKANESLYNINVLFGYKHSVGDKFDVTPLVGGDVFGATRGGASLKSGIMKPKATDRRLSLVLGSKISSTIYNHTNDMVFIPSAHVLFNLGDGKTPKSELSISGSSNNIAVASKKQAVVTTLGLGFAAKKDQFEGSVGLSGTLAPKQHSLSGVIKVKVGF